MKNMRQLMKTESASKYLMLTTQLGVVEAANRLGVTTSTVYYHLRKNNESKLAGVRHQKKDKKQIYTNGGWFSSIPNLKEELKQAKLNKIPQNELAKRYNVSIGSIQIAIKKFGLYPWIYAPKN